MLFGYLNGDIVVECQVDGPWPDGATTIDEATARRLIASTPFRTDAVADEWCVETQVLHRR